MRIPIGKKRRHKHRRAGMELAGALSIASQMALLCPPGFDEWVREEICGVHRGGGEARRAAGRRS